MKFIKIKKNSQVSRKSFVTLSPRRQKRIAKKIAGDCYFLSELLLLLWRNGIDTKDVSAGDYENLIVPQLTIKRDGILKIYSVLDEFLKGVTKKMNGLCHLEIDRDNHYYIISANEKGIFDSKEKFRRIKWGFFSNLFPILNEIISKNKGIDIRFRNEKPLNDLIIEVYINKMLNDKEILTQMKINESDILEALYNEDYILVFNYIFKYIEEKNMSIQQEYETQQLKTQ